MPSPFPGMDPYLEHPEVFPDLHDSLTIYLREYLQPRLPEPYFAGIGSRVWVEISQRYIEPDVNVLRPRNGNATNPSSGGGVAVAARPRSEPVVVTVPHDEHRETFVEIHARQDKHDRLVTCIEILSLANKTPGEHGRELYLRKQKEILDSKTNLVEIDLLRGGEHTTAVPLDLAQAQAGRFDYHVCIHRFDTWMDYLVYPVRLADPLPEISVPLLPGDPAVAVDLQAVFERCWDNGPYQRWIRHAERALVPSLTPEQQEYAQERLKAASGR